jgi:hypothetical protein
MSENTTNNTSTSIETSRPDRQLSMNNKNNQNLELVQIGIENDINTDTENGDSEINQYIFLFLISSL